MIIAVDGSAASGKGTLAKRLAAHFNLAHLDTGSLYRCLALHLLKSGYLPEKIISKISSLLGRKIELSKIDKSDRANANQITEQFQICHNGDNKILSLCQAKDFVLVTFDRMLLKASQFVGVAAFHPSMVGGI